MDRSRLAGPGLRAARGPRRQTGARRHHRASGEVDDDNLDYRVRTRRNDVEQMVAEAASHETNFGAANLERFGPAYEWVDILADLIRVADQLLVEVRAAYQHSSQTVTRVAGDLLQNGITTAQAINLLLEHGFVIDAEARWRALHGLACVCRVIATDSNPPEIAKRFVVNGRRLYEDHVAYSEPWASGTRFYTWSYEWLRESHSLTDKKGSRSNPARSG